MSARPWLASTLGVVLAVAALGSSACSSSEPQDMNNNTDVGIGFIIPDGRPTVTSDAGPETAAADTGDATADGVTDASLVSADVADASPDGPEPDSIGLDGSNQDGQDG